MGHFGRKGEVVHEDEIVTDKRVSPGRRMHEEDRGMAGGVMEQL